MEKLSRCHPIGLPHSGERFVMCSSEEKAAKVSVRIGWGREAREAGPRTTRYPGRRGRGLEDEPVGQTGGGRRACG